MLIPPTNWVQDLKIFIFFQHRNIPFEHKFTITPEHWKSFIRFPNDTVDTVSLEHYNDTVDTVSLEHIPVSNITVGTIIVVRFISLSTF